MHQNDKNNYCVDSLCTDERFEAILETLKDISELGFVKFCAKKGITYVVDW